MDTNSNNLLRDMRSTILRLALGMLSISSSSSNNNISSINRMRATPTKFNMTIIARETTVILILRLHPLCWIILTPLIWITILDTAVCPRVGIWVVILIRTHMNHQTNIKEMNPNNNSFSNNDSNRTLLL